MKLWNDRRLRLSLTRLGVEYLLAMLGLGALAVRSGNNMLYLIFSLMVGLFLVSGWVSRSAIQGLRVLGIQEEHLFVGLGGLLRLRLEDSAPGRVRGLHIQLEVEGGQVEAAFYEGGVGEVSLRAHPERRGQWRLQAIELRTSYPFGFLEKSLRFPLEQELIVFPHPRPGRHTGEGQGEILRPSRLGGAACSAGARPFRPGDPPTRMHWKRTAQRGEPWVRDFEEELSAGIRLRLDLGAWSRDAAFERELERLSGAILHARLRGQEVFLEILGREGRRTHQGRMASWRALALAQAEGACE